MAQEQSSSKLPVSGICYYHQQSGFVCPHHNINNCKLEKWHPGIENKVSLNFLFFVSTHQLDLLPEERLDSVLEEGTKPYWGVWNLGSFTGWVLLNSRALQTRAENDKLLYRSEISL